MDNLKTLYKQKCFQINPLIVKNINKLNLSLNEFLLVLYFINEKNYLDLDSIKATLGFTDEEALNIYSTLLEKGIIEVIVTKENGKANETISLDMFYDKLILNTANDNSERPSDIFSKFESEFGRSLSPIEYERINEWVRNGVAEDTIVGALKEAVINGVPKLRYIETIIYEWTKKAKNRDNEEYKELFDYDWLGVHDE